MYNSTTAINKLNSLVDGAVDAGFDRSKTEAMVAELKNTIIRFYNLDFAYYISNNIEFLTHGLIRAGLRYKDFPTPTGKGAEPKGFNDVSQLFIVGFSMSQTDNETFNNFIIETKYIDETGQEIEEYTSTMVDEWLNEWLNAITSVPANLTLIGEYASDYGILDGLKIIYEAPVIVDVPDVGEIAKDIYITRKYKEVIETLSLSVYIPSYL